MHFFPFLLYNTVVKILPINNFTISKRGKVVGPRGGGGSAVQYNECWKFGQCEVGGGGGGVGGGVLANYSLFFLLIGVAPSPRRTLRRLQGSLPHPLVADKPNLVADKPKPWLLTNPNPWLLTNPRVIHCNVGFVVLKSCFFDILFV